MKFCSYSKKKVYLKACQMADFLKPDLILNSSLAYKAKCLVAK